MNHTSTTSGQSRPNILVIDDDLEIRQMVALILQKSGFRVSSVENTESAHLLLKKEQFDVVVTDVMLPGEDGIQFLSKTREAYPELPVILMTGHAELQMALDAIRNGAFDFIKKPFNLEQLNEVINKAVNYVKLHQNEKNRHIELEETLAARTAELDKARFELDFAHSQILQAAKSKGKSGDSVQPENDASGSICKIFSKVV